MTGDLPTGVLRGEDRSFGGANSDHKAKFGVTHVLGAFVCHKLAEERINAVDRESVRPQTAQR